MTREEKIRLLTLRLDGWSYESIGRELGVSKQYAQQTVMNCVCVRPKKAKIERILYPALRRFVVENCGGSARRFSRLCGVENLGAFLTGQQGAHSKTIEAILKTTGLSFEEAFRTEEVP